MAAAHKVKGIILIVEDEPLIRGFMRDALEEGGYRAEEAGNAHQAMEMLENDGYKAVLTDIGMPGDLNGLDLAWAIEAKWPEIGVVVTSGQTLPAPDDFASHGQIRSEADSRRCFAPGGQRCGRGLMVESLASFSLAQSANTRETSSPWRPPCLMTTAASAYLRDAGK